MDSVTACVGRALVSRPRRIGLPSGFVAAAASGGWERERLLFRCELSGGFEEFAELSIHLAAVCCV
jgi:hypothetical protein